MAELWGYSLKFTKKIGQKDMQSVPRRSPIDQTADPMISSDGPVGETGKVSLYVSVGETKNDVPLTELCVKKLQKTKNWMS